MSTLQTRAVLSVDSCLSSIFCLYHSKSKFYFNRKSDGTMPSQLATVQGVLHRPLLNMDMCQIGSRKLSDLFESIYNFSNAFRDGCSDLPRAHVQMCAEAQTATFLIIRWLSLYQCVFTVIRTE